MTIRAPTAWATPPPATRPSRNSSITRIPTPRAPLRISHRRLQLEQLQLLEYLRRVQQLQRHHQSPALSHHRRSGQRLLLGHPRQRRHLRGRAPLEHGGHLHYVYIVTSLGRVYKLQDTGSRLQRRRHLAVFQRGQRDRNLTAGRGFEQSLLGRQRQRRRRQDFQRGAVQQGAQWDADHLRGRHFAHRPWPRISSTNYLFNANNGTVFRMTTNLGAEVDGTQTTSTVSGRVQVVGTPRPFRRGHRQVLGRGHHRAQHHRLELSGHGRHPARRRMHRRQQLHHQEYLRRSLHRVAYYGDQDGHIYVVFTRAATATHGSLLSGFPIRPTGASSSDSIRWRRCTATG